MALLATMLVSMTPHSISKPCRLPCKFYTLGQPEYENVRFVQADNDNMTRIGNVNTLFNVTKPAIIMIAKTASDVVDGVKWAVANKMKVKARSGGHSYTACSLISEGLVIDVSQLNVVEPLSSGLVKVGSGAKLGTIYDELLKVGLALPGGTCRTVGIAGLALGGGHGALARESGLTLDRIVAMDIVTADGTLRHVSAKEDADLFWGLRGGGQNLGVVTAFTFKPVKAHLWFFYTTTITWDTTMAIKWQTWSHDEPAASWHALHLSRNYMKLIGMYSAELCAPDCTWNLCTKDSDCSMIPGSYCSNGICHGTGPNTTYVKNRLVSGLGVPGPWDKIFNWNWQDAVTELDFPPDDLPHAWMAKSLYVMPKATLNATAFDSMRTTLQTAPTGVQPAINLDAYGGVISDVEASATAFPYRSALCSVQSINTLDASADVEGTKEWLRQFASAMRPWDKGGYVNYPDVLGVHGADAAMEEYFGSNADALRTVKRAYDPSGLFGDICAVTLG